MDKVNEILNFLDDAGIGNPTKINTILKGLYPEPQLFDCDNDYFIYAGRISNFLNELQSAKLLKYRIEGFFRAKINGKCFLLDDCTIIASITYKGSESLANKIPTQVNYSANFHRNFSGNFNQGKSEDLSQITKEDSKESKELTKKMLEDFPKLKRYRHWGFIIAIIAIIVAIIFEVFSNK